MSRPNLKEGLGIMFSKKVELAINNAGWTIEGNTLVHSNYPNCGIALNDMSDANVTRTLRLLLNSSEDSIARNWIVHLVGTERCPTFSPAKVVEDTEGMIEEALYLVDILGTMPEADGYCFAVHCNEQANPAEASEVVIFDSEANRDDFIKATSWPYEAVNEPTEIYAGPFWDWAEVIADLAELGYPSHVIWRYEPKKTEPDMMVITTTI